MSDDIFHPKVVEDTPLPGQTGVSFDSSQKSSKDTYSPQVQSAQDIPIKKTAQELLSSSLNTKSRSIIGVYQFTESGAIKIGNFVFGQSGEILISPSGITARNKAGETTLAVDGETGDAIFKGIIQSGALITGRIVVGEDEGVVIDGENGGTITIKDENGTTIIDSKGLVSTANFNSSSATDNTSREITGGTYGDVSGTTLTFTLERSTKLIIMMSVVANIFMGSDTNGAGASVVLNIDGTNQTSTIFEQDILDSAKDPNLAPFNFTRQWPLNATGVITLAAGSHTLKLQASVLTSGHKLNILRSSLIYMILGK
jgi:hypothetical protein